VHTLTRVRGFHGGGNIGSFLIARQGDVQILLIDTRESGSILVLDGDDLLALLIYGRRCAHGEVTQPMQLLLVRAATSLDGLEDACWGRGHLSARNGLGRPLRAVRILDLNAGAADRPDNRLGRVSGRAALDGDLGLGRIRRNIHITNEDDVVILHGVGILAECLEAKLAGGRVQAVGEPVLIVRVGELHCDHKSKPK